MAGPTSRQAWQTTDTILLVGLVASWIVVALIVGDDFGISWDEWTIVTVGQSALDSYSTLTQHLPGLEKLAYYGPAFAAMVSFGTRALQGTLHGWEVYDLRHLLYSLSMPLAAVSVYAICRGLVNRGAALFGSLLLLTQPLLVGHSFINPKDMPLMAVFTAAAACGFAAVRHLPSELERDVHLPERSSAGWWVRMENRLRTRWRTTPGWLRAMGITCLLAALAVLLDIFFFHRLILPAMLSLVTAMYHGTAPALLQQAFDRQADFRSAVPLEAYLHKATAFHASVSGWAAGIAALLAAGFTMAKYPPRTGDVGRGFVARFFSSAVLVGLATAIRVVGPLAGALISGLLLVRRRFTALAWLLLYWMTAALVTVAAWPLLWSKPVKHFVRSLDFMADFPWNDPVLFRGVFIRATDLPWDYSLTQFALQLTLPALVLGLVGGVWALFHSRGDREHMAELSLLWIWLATPFVLTIAGDVNVYDNARQLIFALPPLFVLAGVGFQLVTDRLPIRPIRVGLALALLVPGVVAIFQLHPYEYIYYNELAGGVGGASRRFEMDYWGTGFREAMLYLDTIAPESATYSVLGSARSAEPFARPDMILWSASGTTEGNARPDFILATSRWNWDLDPSHWNHYAKAAWWPDARIVWTLERDGAPLVVIKAHEGGP